MKKFYFNVTLGTFTPRLRHFESHQRAQVLPHLVARFDRGRQLIRKRVLDPSLNVIPANCKVIMPTAPIRKMGSLFNQPVHSWYNSYKWKKDFVSWDELFANYV